MISGDIGVWVAATLTIFVYSFVYRDTILFKIAEHTVLALSIGYLAVQAIKNILNIAWYPIASGTNYIYIIPIIFGFLLYTMYSSEYRYMSRWSISIVIGTGTSLAMRSSLETNIIGQIVPTFMTVMDLNIFKSIENIVFMIMVISCLFYFYFTIEHKGTLQYVSKLARYTLMLCFGTHYGGTVLSRLSLLIGRFQFLIYNWLGLG